MARFQIGSVITEVVDKKLVLDNISHGPVLLLVGNDLLADRHLWLVGMNPSQHQELTLEDENAIRVIVLTPVDIIAEALLAGLPYAVVQLLEQFEAVMPTQFRESGRGVIHLT